MLVTELWGLGDLVLAIPFLRSASAHAKVTLVAKPHAAPIIARFAPAVELAPLVAPWTAFRGKYRLSRWPWGELGRTLRILRSRSFDIGATARPDPRDHVLIALAGASRRYGYPRAGSRLFLNRPLQRPANPHRAQYWSHLASALGFAVESTPPAPRTGRRIVIHTGAGQPAKLWPRERYIKLAALLDGAGWQTEVIDDSLVGLERLMAALSTTDRFIGNDSGPGHLAALLGVPTFTVGPQSPEIYSPQHPRATWIEGAPCRFKPCRDYCHFPEPLCLTAIDVESVRKSVFTWLET
jgi:ADP-heptose:LPS heptosyltransferase